MVGRADVIIRSVKLRYGVESRMLALAKSYGRDGSVTILKKALGNLPFISYKKSCWVFEVRCMSATSGCVSYGKKTWPGLG